MRAIIAAFLANLCIAIMKFVAYLFTGSGAMLAESIHSVADTGNQALLLLGGRRAQRAPTPSHPFGYGRERYFWAFVVALVLFSLGSAFSIYEGIEKIRHPHDVESPAWAFAVLGVAVVLELFSFRTATHESRPLKGDASWWSFIRHSRIPELPVVLLEDLGALLGLMFAVVAVTLTVVTGDTLWDALGTLMIGTLLGIIAVILAWEMKSLLIGESATVQKQRSIEDAINEQGAVRRLIHMRTEHIGPEELLVGAKIEFEPDLTMTEAAVRSSVPEARIVYLEPAIVGPAQTTGADAPSAPTASTH